MLLFRCDTKYFVGSQLSREIGLTFFLFKKYDYANK